jgi:hypothetical protein
MIKYLTMKFNYYYNNVPGDGLCRNNLIYTSLISEDHKTFCQWYHNDSEYHKGKNEVVDPALMEEKWLREVKFLMLMSKEYPNQVPEIEEIDFIEKKIYLKIDGVDFWQLHFDKHCTYDIVLPDWQDQMINIFQSYKTLGLWKYSLHPSSYFIVDGQLKSINYFFTYQAGEGPITVKDHLSHISKERRAAMKVKTDAMGIDWNEPQSLLTMQMLTFESFRNNYPTDFIERAKNVFL